MYFYRFVILSLNLLLCYSFAQSNYYYSYDGAGNNLNQPDWGKQGNLVTREGPSLPFAYADGISAMRTDLPASKVVSNDLFSIRPAQPMSGVKLSDLHTAWGFIMAHDISLSKSGGENSPIQVPQNDTKWNPSGIPIESYPTARMQVPFSRKAPTPNATAANPRSTYFTSTPFLDLQPFYGFTENTTRKFRDLNTKGRLKTSAGNNLPLDPIANGMSAGSVPGGQVSSETYFIGENQFLNFMPQVAPLATIFLREHNRKADELASLNPNWSGDKVFEEARRWVIALYQSITWNEYIPAMLDMTPTYTGYDSNVEPTIHALWLAAACRYAHTELNSLIYPLDSDYNFHSGGPMLLRDNVQKTSPAVKKYGVDAILRGTLSHISMEFDSFYEDDMRVFGLGRFPGGGSFDIASMTIQRSRDLGIPGYNDVRAALGLSRKESFSEISTDQVVINQLSRLYGSIDNIDFFVGALAESHPGKHFSESMAAAFENQVMRIIKSDRLFYKSSSSGFSNSQRNEIDRTSLADLILLHTEINKTQCKSFYWKGVRDCVRSTGNTGTTGTTGTIGTSGTGTTGGNGQCTRVNSNTLPDSFPDTMNCCYGLQNPTITVPLSHNGDITLNFGNSIVMSDGSPISQGCNGGAFFYKNGTVFTDVYKGNDGVTRNSIDVFYATGSTIKLRNIQSWQSNLPSLLNGKDAMLFVTCNNGVSSCLKFNVVNP